MAAPSPTPRVDPGGIKLDDGYRSLVTIAADTDISLWEIGVTPPGMDGGDPIDTTTMHNDTYRTMASRALKTLTEFTFRFAYDPAVYTQLETNINVETTITITYPDGSTLAFYGFLRSAEFDELVEGTRPEGTATITPTNFDPTNKVEAAPALASVAGT
jgi:hypothetical protein